MPYFITFFSSLIYSLLFSEHFHMCVQLYISHTQLFSFRRAHSHLVSFSVAPSDWNVVSRVHRCLYARSESFKFVYIHTHTHTTTRPPAHIPMHFLSSFVVNPSRTENVYIINTCTMHTHAWIHPTVNRQHINTCKHIRNCILIIRQAKRNEM